MNSKTSKKISAALNKKDKRTKDELLAAVARMFEPPEKPAAPARQRGGRPRPARPVVLVVEDNRDNLLVITAVLDEAGYKGLGKY